MIRLAEPDIGMEEVEAIAEVLKSGWLVMGKRVEEFEGEVSRYLGTPFAIAVSSGTAALHLALIALGIKENDEVIVPAVTFPATANVVELVGARPIFVDIDLETYNIDISKLFSLLKTDKARNVKAIIPVHLFGQPVDMFPILEIAKKRGWFVIEDAACALGAEYKTKKCGTFGDIGCFSFHPRKVVTTGEGGMLVSRNERVAESLRVLRNHGIYYYGNKTLDFVAPGFNYRMTDFQAAMGIVQMKKLEKNINKRITLAKVYNQLLSKVEWLQLPPIRNDCKHIFQSYVILLREDRIDREILRQRLMEKGIETTIGSYALHMLRYYKEKYGYSPKDFPNSKTFYERSLTLPLHTKMEESDVEFVAESLINIGRQV